MCVWCDWYVFVVEEVYWLFVVGVVGVVVEFDEWVVGLVCDLCGFDEVLVVDYEVVLFGCEVLVECVDFVLCGF